MLPTLAHWPVHKQFDARQMTAFSWCDEDPDPMDDESTPKSRATTGTMTASTLKQLPSPIVYADCYVGRRPSLSRGILKPSATNLRNTTRRSIAFSPPSAPGLAVGNDSSKKKHSTPKCDHALLAACAALEPALARRSSVEALSLRGILKAAVSADDERLERQVQATVLEDKLAKRPSVQQLSERGIIDYRFPQEGSYFPADTTADLWKSLAALALSPQPAADQVKDDFSDKAQQGFEGTNSDGDKVPSWGEWNDAEDAFWSGEWRV